MIPAPQVGRGPVQPAMRSVPPAPPGPQPLYTGIPSANAHGVTLGSGHAFRVPSWAPGGGGVASYGVPGVRPNAAGQSPLLAAIQRQAAAPPGVTFGRVGVFAGLPINVTEAGMKEDANLDRQAKAAHIANMNA